MAGERSPVDSPRLPRLAEKFQDKRYRDGYVAAHTRGLLARQMRNFRGELSQSEFGSEIGKRQTVVSRLESSAYGGWALRTMLEIARKRNIALFCRFVDFPTFLKYTGDLSDEALNPSPYDQQVIDDFAQQYERQSEERALKALFSAPKEPRSPSKVLSPDVPIFSNGLSALFGLPRPLSDKPANDDKAKEPLSPVLPASRSNTIHSAAG